MKEIKQNKNSSVIRFLAFVTAVVVLVFSISIPSFAYTDTSTNGVDFTGQPLYRLNNDSWASAYSNSGPGFTYDGVDWHLTVASNSIIADYYAFYYSNTIYCVSPTDISSSAGTLTIWGVYPITDGFNATQFPVSYWGRDNSTGLYIRTMTWSSMSNITSFSIPVFSSKSAGLNAVIDWINNPPPVEPVPDPQGPLNISIPCGNALFIDISGLTGLTGSLSTQTSQSHSSPFSWNSTLSYTDSVPTSGSPVGNPINWVGTGGTDVFGRYRSWQCNLIVQPNKKYIAITNPFFNSEYLDPEHEDTNFPITVSLSNYRDYFFVPLNAQYVNGEGIQNNYTDEQTQAPTPGGNNTTTTGNSINDFLQNIASSISGFFQGAIGAVSTLVSAGSDFMRSVSGLYTWLPAPVYTVLTSAIILVITIGVIKVFI